MKNQPLVSIIVPAYNVEHTIELCLRTLVKQTYPVKEIIVVDDGSVDDTNKILSKMAQDCQLYIFSHKHSGITATRNAGLHYSRGEIVFYGEADAIYSKDYVEKAVKLLTSNQRLGGVCVTGAPWIIKSTVVTQSIDVENRIQRKLLREGKIEPFYAWIFRREALEEVGGYDEKLFQAEDKDVFIRIKEQGYSIGLVTGINWRHMRGQNLWSFLKRNYWGGKTRILYLINHRKIHEFFRGVGLLWFLILMGILGPVLSHVFYYMAILGFSVAFIYKSILIIRLGRDFMNEKRLFLFIPLFSVLRHLASAVGYSMGLSVFLVRKLVNKPVDWSSMR
jgi:glycosyltransferase involved in cell wall biosynthesis